MEWYPHYISDYDGDTLHLSLAEDGAYCRLIRWYYKNERPIPNDPVALAGICRVSVAEWEQLSAKILPLFVTRDTRVGTASVLHHKRCDKVLLKQNKSRRDWKSRQENLRKHNILEPVTRDTRVTLAAKGKERKGYTDRDSNNKYIGHFEKFWSAYPRKVAKGQAIKAFAKAVKTVDPETIIQAAHRYAEERAGQEQNYTKHPATWINGQCWDDGIETPAEKPPPGVDPVEWFEKHHGLNGKDVS